MVAVIIKYGTRYYQYKKRLCSNFETWVNLRISQMLSYMMDDSSLGPNPRKFWFYQAPEVVLIQADSGSHYEKRMESQWGNEAVIKCSTDLRTSQKTASVFFTDDCVSSTQKSCLPWVRAPGGLRLPLGSGRKCTFLGLLFPFWARMAAEDADTRKGWRLHTCWYCFQQKNKNSSQSLFQYVHIF